MIFSVLRFTQNLECPISLEIDSLYFKKEKKKVNKMADSLDAERERGALVAKQLLCALQYFSAMRDMNTSFTLLFYHNNNIMRFMCCIMVLLQVDCARSRHRCLIAAIEQCEH